MPKKSITTSFQIKYKIFPNYSLNYKMWQNIELLTFQKDTSNGTALDQRFLPRKVSVLEGACSIESKKPGGNIRSNLKIIIGISLSNLSISSTLIVVEVKPLKKRLNSVKACHTFVGRSSRKAIGINHCTNTWKSWLFIPNNL